MKILMASCGSYGHISPYINLAIALRKKGHDVFFAVEEYFLPIVKQYGFECDYFIDSNIPSDLTQADLMGFVLKRYHIDSLDCVDKFVSLCSGVDLIIRDPTTVPVADIVAEYLNIPCVDYLVTLGHYMGPEATRWLSLMSLRKVNAVRVNLGLSETNHIPFDIFKTNRLKISDIPPFYLQSLRDKEEYSHIFADENFYLTNFTPLIQHLDLPDYIDSFIDSGEPPVVFAMGSAAQVSPNPLNFFDYAYEVSKKHRTIILGDNLGYEEHPNLLFAPGELPHHLIFNRARVVITHSGLGTIGKCLLDNVPQIGIPQMAENRFCGELLSGLFEIIYPEHLTLENLLDSIDNLKYNYDLGREWSEYVRSVDGAELAIEIMEKHKYLHE